MANTTKTKTSKQRSTKSRSLSSSRPKTLVKRKPATVTRKLINLPLGGGAHLTLAINKPKKHVKKRQPKSKKTAQQSDKLLTLFLLVVGSIGTVFFGLRVAFAAPAPPVAQPVTVARKTVPVPAKPSLPRSIPSKLRIPDIQLDADLATVGLRSDGSLDVPADYTKAGWYEASPAPGQIGPAIIDGHLDNIHGVAVFWRLHELVPGQGIEIDRQDGTTAHFVIDTVKQFPQDNFPTAEVYGNTKNASLRLITCGGTFSRLSGHYDQNTIVFASLKN